jgi:hypothetical protein
VLAFWLTDGYFNIISNIIQRKFEKKAKKISNPSTPSAALPPSLSFFVKATKEPTFVFAEATTNKTEGRQGFG